ncbi:MAG: hypothetical protein SOV71_00070 [Anaerovoracaceae bacterium]|nr:hypothetical protein [Bacillota bacterium]MDY2669942.1 hypothetical protein [Anaerovoracaceae bacterium]
MNYTPDKLNKTRDENIPETEAQAQADDTPKESRGLKLGAVISVIVLAAVAAALIAGAFAASGKRADAAEKQQADAFARELTETLENKGQDRVEKQFWKGYDIKNKGIFDGLMFDIVDAYDKYGPSDKKFSILNKDGEYEIPNTGEIRRYSIVGAKYKGEKYDVSVEYDPSGYGKDADKSSRAYNVNEFPDTGSLSAESTAVINPESAYLTFDTDSSGNYEYDSTTESFKHKGSSMEQSAADKFYTKYTTFYENAVAEADTYLAQAGIDSSHMLSGADFIQPEKKAEKTAEMKKSISRDTTLLAYGSGEGVGLKSNVVFTLADPTQIGMPQTVMSALQTRLQGATITQLQEDGTMASRTVTAEDINAITSAVQPQIQALWNDSTSSSSLQEQFTVYESDNSFTELKNIYLMYYPLKISEWESDTVNIDISAVNGKYKSDKKLDLYIVPQLGLIASKTVPYDAVQASDYIAPELNGGTVAYGQNGMAETSVSVANPGTLFDMNRIRVNYIKGWFRTLAAADMRDSVVAENGSQDIIYDLKVGIYRSSGGRYAGKDLITTRETSCS